MPEPDRSHALASCALVLGTGAFAGAPDPAAAAGPVRMEEVAYGKWPHCVRLSNGLAELVVTTDVGPRIIRYGFPGGPNFFHEYADQRGLTGGDRWRNYGGHRLWIAPEHPVRTYAPDNLRVPSSWDGVTLRLRPRTEATTGIQKEIAITLDPASSQVTVEHLLHNRNKRAVRLAPWALSVMAPSGRAIFPHEPFRPHPGALLPVRPLVLWAYTDMSDPRFTWGNRYIQVRQDPAATTKQKIGLLNTQGWAAYALDKQVFLKRYPYLRRARYPDFGVNTECWTDPEMLEVETLGALRTLPPGRTASHVERWSSARVAVGASESDIAAALEPMLRESPALQQ